MDIDIFQVNLNKLMIQANYQPLPHFEGYSPYEMHLILNFTLGLDSPIVLQKLPDSDYEKIPLFNIIKTLLDMIDKGNGLKLTQAGYLPTKIVAELYELDFMNTNSRTPDKYKPKKESDTRFIHLARILIEMSGLVKKRHGALSLTKSSKKLLRNNEDLLKKIFITFTTKFNWAYEDYYGDNHVGQLGSGFTLILLSKYGHTKKLDSFYSDKYVKAFPEILDNVVPIYSTREKYVKDCYSSRTFYNFLRYFGLIEVESTGELSERMTYVKKTDLFDRLIHCKPHKAYFTIV